MLDRQVSHRIDHVEGMMNRHTTLVVAPIRPIPIIPTHILRAPEIVEVLLLCLRRIGP